MPQISVCVKNFQISMASSTGFRLQAHMTTEREKTEEKHCAATRWPGWSFYRKRMDMRGDSGWRQQGKRVWIIDELIYFRFSLIQICVQINTSFSWKLEASHIVKPYGIISKVNQGSPQYSKSWLNNIWLFILRCLHESQLYLSFVYCH